MMRNITQILKILYVSLLGVLISSGFLNAQNFDVTLAEQCNPTTGGNETLVWNNVPPNANGDGTLTFTYNGDLNGTSTNPEFITFIDELGATIGLSNATGQCAATYDSVSFNVPLATLLSWTADGTVTITADGDPTINNICSGNSFCVIARLQYPVVTGPDDIGVASLDSPGTFFCSGNYNLVTTVQNYGTNQVNNYTVNWSWNGILETPITVNTPLDTINGTGSNSSQVTLGNKAISGVNTLKVWTSSPNGVADTVNVNDTVEVTLNPSIQAPTTLSSTNILSSSALLNWVEIGSSSQWQIEYGPLGFTQGNGTSVITMLNPYSLSGLSSNTAYDFYVRSICSGGDTSLWSGPSSFTTACTIYPNPFVENFDGGAWPNGGATIDQCWSRNPTTGFSWRGNTGTTSSTATGPSGDVNGSGTYAYPEASSGSVGSASTLTTPPIDVSNLTNPSLEFYYHRFGDGMGDFNVIVNGTSTIDTVFTLVGVDPSYTSVNDPWTFVSLPLTGFGGDTITISFVSGIGSTGFSFNSDMSLDEIKVFQPIPEDLSAIAIDAITSGCGLTSTETIATRIVNFGTATFNSGFSIPVSADVNGVVTTENITLSAAFAPGDTVAYTFAAPFDLSAFGAYNLKVYPSLAGDTANTNDTVFQTITNIPIISNYPYSENFDSGPGGWVASGNTTWALGAPTGAIINSASSAPNAWVTNLTGLYNNGEDGIVTGPCFAFDSLIAPEVSVDVWWNSETSFDGMQLQSSLDGGSTWQKVSFVGDPNSTNWYNGTFFGLGNAGSDPEGWGGRNGNESPGWVTASADLSALSGQPDALFRLQFGSDGSVNGEGIAFDNFQLVETALPFNIELVDIVSPVSGCGLSSTDTVILEYANIGLNPITTGTTLNFSYYLNGVATNENLVLSADLLPGDTAFYTFTATVDLSTPATYAFGAIATFAPDQNPLDDSLGLDIISIPVISSFPYYQDFESGNGGWTSGGTNSSWALGTPATANIVGASSGTQAWNTNLTGIYNPNEEAFVLGPCFDFTSLTLPLIKIDVNWNSEFSWDGAQVQASTNAGATWQPIGAFGDPDNWYTDNTVNGLAFTNQEGWTGRQTSGNGSGGWVTAENNLTSFAGNSGVLMRVVFGSDGSVQDEGFAFDNFHILESPNNDIKVDSLFGLQSGCGFTANTPITMRITNKGILPQSNIPVFYTVNGVASPTETIAGPINPGATFVYNFTNNADLSVPQTYTMVGRSALPTDEDTTNDASSAKIFASLFTPVVDSVMNGETCESGPVTLEAFSTGDTDRWFDVSMGGTALGTGNTYTIPNVTQDDTLYVESVQSTTGCNSATVSGRIPVYAFHSTTPVINFTSQVTGGLTITFTSSLSPNVDSVLWDFNDGTFATAANPQHTFPQSQSYLITLTAYAGSCIADTVKAVFVPVGGINDNAYTNLNVYPNPSNGSFRISADNIDGEVSIEIISITGTVVYNEISEAINNELNHDVRINNLAQGSYILKIRNDKTLINGRIVIE